MKEIHVSDPNKVLKFFQSQLQQKAVFDSQKGNMMAMNKSNSQKGKKKNHQGLTIYFQIKYVDY